MAPLTASLIAESVNDIIQAAFPDRYFSLCHVYAVVGANVASIALGREYRPVAGLAVIDCGGGHFLEFLDNQAFSNEAGGAFHCWIESASDASAGREIIDLTYRHNPIYAQQNQILWCKEDAPNYLWGLHKDIVLDDELSALPSSFPSGKIWLRETDQGFRWINQYVESRLDEYAKLSGFALRLLRNRVSMKATKQTP
jgi:hypothetical protein